MFTQENHAQAVQNVAPSNEVEANTNDQSVVKDASKPLYILPKPLTGVKADKVAMFWPFYQEHTPEFVDKCSGRGENSWKKVAQRIHDLETADESQNAYTSRLYEEFELDVTIQPITIIKTIGTVRRELKMPIGEQSTKWYIEQVCSLYLVEKVMDESVGYSKVIGYKFLFRLKP